MLNCDWTSQTSVGKADYCDCRNTSNNNKNNEVHGRAKPNIQSMAGADRLRYEITFSLL